MNFFDYMSLLTIGRGGKFTERQNTLTYHASGHEPLMWVGSSRGVPDRAKGLFGPHPPSCRAQFFDSQALNRLRAAPLGVDFMTDVWPLIAKDALWAYYDTLAQQQPEAFAQDPRHVLRGIGGLPFASADLDDSSRGSSPTVSAP